MKNESKLNIMIVDDEDDQRVPMQWLLEEWGYDVQNACNGKEALDLARQRCPDVVLMDLNMPVMTGFEATRRLRALPETAQTRVIAISGYLNNNPEWVVRGIAAGCDTCFGKPVDLGLLQAELLRIGRTRHTRSSHKASEPPAQQSPGEGAALYCRGMAAPATAWVL
jgi:two-component system cell cycle response regulator DivK